MTQIQQIIGHCDKRSKILGGIERWEAHKKGILHRAFALAIVYKNYYILQHRKHPVFDGVFDITSSSHQLYSNGKLQDTLEAAKFCLFREARDAKSVYTEHEICDIVEVRLKKIPTPAYEFAYGSSLVTKGELANKKSRIYSLLAPWVKVAIKKNLI
ncbi:MAG: hypothetical protein UT57_C0031G0011 [Microgenomates group bacterium GW2011_GWC1_39_7]|nr:MAG: hypothetical protein UT57_C0031G0011 [Microgenomates group bacterium GW2011_GWC1_39_7]